MAVSPRDKRVLIEWALALARPRLQVFERVAPRDGRPREALRAARAYLQGRLHFRDLKRAILEAHAAARAVEDGPARWAARCAAQAASTCHAAGHAGGALLYAQKVARDPAGVRAHWLARLPVRLRRMVARRVPARVA